MPNAKKLETKAIFLPRLDDGDDSETNVVVVDRTAPTPTPDKMRNKHIKLTSGAKADARPANKLMASPNKRIVRLPT